MEDKNKTTKSYKDTLNLPKTDFPIRPDHKIDDKRLLEKWQQEDLYKKTFYLHEGSAKYVLHDGPPYANGHIHIGHAYNKILKDIVTKAQRMEGNHVPVTPGWDCHGLPIEKKVSEEHPYASPQELKKACRAYAAHWIDVQRNEFKALGVLMDWSRPYITMDYHYEADIMRAFGDFVDKGYIEKKNKTVAWCATDQTVLASAEIEYKERKDPSIFVKFPLLQQDVTRLFPSLQGSELSFLVWTTTPWTLPLNRAVLLKPGANYQVLMHNNNYLIVGAPLADKICAMLGIEKNVVAEIAAEAFKESKAEHPFAPRAVPILLEQFVSLEDGTACVHCAPGCGPEDYEVGVRNNLEIYSPVGPAGTYTVGIEPQELLGVAVADAQGWVIKTLTEKNKLVHKTSIKHSYPHCWRCRNGLIFRATSQWFCSLSHNGLKERALALLEKIEFVPRQSINHLRAAIENRLEWCLSRQRVWGIPITALLCNHCDYVYITKELIDCVARGVEKEGIEYWDTVVVEQLLPKNFACPSCKHKEFKKEQDILDVWFDSGVSHYAVLKQNRDLAYPADMYLEGRDQARGWFQSSLLTSMTIEQTPCMRSIVTHGYTVDGLGQKMSKSLGNVVAPQEIIDDMGTDGLRLWASSIDFKDDAVVSKELLSNVKEVYRKVRNTARFLLSNLYDFDISKDAVSFDQMLLVDRYALYQLNELSRLIRTAYNQSKFTTVFHALTDYCAKELSAFYLDISKDRLYVEKANGRERRSAQTAYWYILDTMTKLMAPILSFTAETIYESFARNKVESIHVTKFVDSADLWAQIEAQMFVSFKDELGHSIAHEQWESAWKLLFDVRSAMLKAIEKQRELGIIKHPLEAQLLIYFDQNNAALMNALRIVSQVEESTGRSLKDFFKDFLVVSSVTIEPSADGLEPSEFKGMWIMVFRAGGDKCPRCWQYSMSEHIDKLCKRCQHVAG